MKISFFRKLMLLPALLVLAACGAIQPAAIPSPTTQANKPPTATPARPRATPARPTPAPSAAPAQPAPAPSAAPDVTGDSAAIQAALEKTKSATTYRMQFTNIQPLGIFAPSGEMEKVGTLFDYSGAFNSQDAHWISKGAAFELYEVDPVKGYEVLLVADRAYLRGPFAPLGAAEERWYNVDYDQIAPIVLNAGKTLELLFNTGVNLAEFAAAGSEMLDGQQCTVHRAEQNVTLNVLNGMALSTEPPDTRPAEQQFEGTEIQQTETTLWRCADGYLHQLKVHLAGTRKADSSQQVIHDVLLHMYDFESSIEIVAPADIEPGTIGGMRIELFPREDLTVPVFNGGNVREWPVDGKPLDQINAGEKVMLMARNSDGTWYQVMNIRAVTGWVSATLLTIDPAVVELLDADDPVAFSEQFGDPTAIVFNGGNVRVRPVSGKPLDQIKAGEKVRLLARNQDGTWYRIMNVRSVTGWVSASLLTIDPAVAQEVPIEEP